MPKYTSARCAHGPGLQLIVAAVDVETPVAPFAGATYAGGSGGSGTNAVVSARPVVFPHLRSKLVLTQLKNQGLVVK